MTELERIKILAKINKLANKKQQKETIIKETKVIEKQYDNKKLLELEKLIADIINNNNSIVELLKDNKKNTTIIKTKEIVKIIKEKKKEKKIDILTEEDIIDIIKNNIIQPKVQRGGGGITKIRQAQDVDTTGVVNNSILKYNDTTSKWEISTDSAGVSWGGVTGTLSNQTDLQNALDEKAELVPTEVIGKLSFNTVEPTNPNINDSYISNPTLEATNYNKWSEKNTYLYPWNYNDGVVFYENFAADPNGNITSAKVAAINADSGYHAFRTSSGVQQFNTYEIITISGYFKPSHTSIGGVIIGDRTSSGQARFDLLTQTIYSVGTQVIDTGIVSAGNGYYRCWTTFIFSNSIGNGYLYSGMYIIDSSSNINFVGADEGLLVWGTMVAIGGITPYVATNGSVVTETLPLTGTVTTTQTFTAENIYTWNGTIWEEFVTYDGLSIFIKDEDKPYTLTSLGLVKTNPWTSTSDLKDIYYENGKVGISKVPLYEMDVGGVLNVQPNGSSAYIRQYLYSNVAYIDTSWNGLRFFCRNTGGYEFNPHYSSTYGLFVKQNNEYVLFVGGNNGIQGNVGIGTNTPSEKLEVTGKIKATSINFSGLPTSATGLVAGDVWNDAGTLKII